MVEQLGRIELRGIQTSHRVLQDLGAVYVPLHLEAVPEVTDGKAGERITILPNSRSEVFQVLQQHRQILVVGAPGSGKSTLLSYLAIRMAAGQVSQETRWNNDPLPLMVRVRALKSPALTPSNLASHLGCDEELVTLALTRQKAALFVDGLDEAPPALRERLIDSLHRFVRRYPKVQVVATSRPTGSPGEVEKRLHGLQPFRLVDLARDEVDTFIDKWCLAAEMSVRREPAEAEKEARVAAADLKRRLAASYSVQRIASNPLLVTILCVVHRFLGKSIPEHRVTLYEKCTDALLYEWDRAKFEEGSAIGLLDAPAKRRLLMEVARRVHEEHAAEISEHDVIRHFAETLPNLGRPATDAKQIIAEIRDRSGLLVERRPGFFAFSHLTFQEYLCALDYVRTKSLGELVNCYQEPWWHEVIVLAAGVPGGGDGTVTRRLLAKRHPTAIFLAAQCLETETDMPLAIRERIEKALQKMVPPKDFKSVQRLQNLGIVVAPTLAKSLQTADADGRALTLLALMSLNYDPAVPAIAMCASDDRPSGSQFISGHEKSLSIGGFATLVLIMKSSKSDVAKLALKEAVLRTPIQDLIDLRSFGSADNDRTLRDALKARSQEISAPKRAKSIASTPPSREASDPEGAGRSAAREPHKSRQGSRVPQGRPSGRPARER
jgi:energy-coupling factor transporter ATP-binding protein EcfA2